MVLEIDSKKCIDCGLCDRYCPTDVIHMQDLKIDGKARWYPVEKYPNECFYCDICAMVCPTDAIKVKLLPIQLKI